MAALRREEELNASSRDPAEVIRRAFWGVAGVASAARPVAIALLILAIIAADALVFVYTSVGAVVFPIGPEHGIHFGDIAAAAVSLPLCVRLCRYLDQG